MEDEMPMVAKQRGILSKYVVAGLASFGVILLLIVGVVVLSNATVPKAPAQDSASDFHVASSAINTSATYSIPCTTKGTPAGCDNSRVRTVVCNSVNTNGYPTVTLDNKVSCESAKVSLQQYLNVQFFQTAGTTNCLEITIRVGECWGKNPINNGVYDCQGECGAGCVNGCGIFSGGGGWSRNCLRHDICSWHFGASGGGSDANCGKSYNQASGDIFNCNCEVPTHTCNF